MESPIPVWFSGVKGLCIFVAFIFLGGGGLLVLDKGLGLSGWLRCELSVSDCTIHSAADCMFRKAYAFLPASQAPKGKRESGTLNPKPQTLSPKP